MREGLAVGLAVALLASACFDPQAADCALRCHDDAECPSGQSCLEGGRCAGPAVTSCAEIPGTGGDAGTEPGGAAHITCNDETTCALKDGAIYCWGANDVEQIPGVDGPGPAWLPGSFAGETPVDLASGFDHFCATTDAGRLFCWGSEARDRTGTGTSAVAPLAIDDPVTAVDGGIDYGCALAGGQLYCWGTPACGEIEASATPAATGVTADGLIAGDEFLCLLQSRQLRCRGRNDRQQCGASESSSLCAEGGELTGTPEWNPVLEGRLAGGSAARHHGCAVLDGGELYCWGSASNGKLGTGTTSGTQPPLQVELPCPVQTVATGYAHTCAVCQSDGRVFCWGDNAQGAVGSAGVPTEPEGSAVAAPVEVPGLPAVVDLCAGEDHSCAVTSDGQAYCWGGNDEAQLGPQAGPAGSATPVAVPLP